MKPINYMLAGLGLLLVTNLAQAGVILGPISATANQATRPGFPLDSLFDQNGLSLGYTSGVTDSDTYLASNPTHNGTNAARTWGTNNGVTSAQVTFDLGGSTFIESIVLWNRGLAQQGVDEFRLLACADMGCTSSVILGNFSATAALGSNSAVLAERFDFTSTMAAYIQMDILSSHNTTCCITLGEVAFGQGIASVPEPATLLLISFGLAGIGFRKRKA